MGWFLKISRSTIRPRRSAVFGDQTRNGERGIEKETVDGDERDLISERKVKSLGIELIKI